MTTKGRCNYGVHIFQIQRPTFFVICTRFIRLMVPTGLIGAVKPNTKAFKQNNLKSAQLLSSEGAQRGETKQKITSVKSSVYRVGRINNI